MKQHCGRVQGFTLVELMTIIAIVGLLAVIAIPAFVDAREKAQRIAGYSEKLTWEQFNERMKESQKNANVITPTLTYFMDPRTGLCFAYYSRYNQGDSPTITCVPCEAIPANMLSIAVVPSNPE